MPSAGPDRRLIIELGARNRTRGAIDSIKAQIRSIPTMRNIQIRAQLSGISGVRGQISGIRGKTVTVIARADVAAADTAIQGIKGRSVTVVVNAEIGGAQTAIDGIKGRSVTVVANAEIGAAQTAIDGIKGRSVTVVANAEIGAAQTAIDGIKGRSVTVVANAEIGAAQTAIDGIKGRSVTVVANAEIGAAQTAIDGITPAGIVVLASADIADAQTSIGAIKGRVINVIVDAEVAGAQTEINGIKGRSVTVTVESEIAAAQTAIDGIKGRTVTVAVEADTAAAQTSIGAIKGRVINVIVDAEVAGAQTEISGIKGRAVTITADATTAAAQTSIDGIKGRTVTVTVEAATAGAQTAINGIKGRVINVIVDAEVAGAQTEINGIKGRTVTVVAEADTAAAQTAIDGIKGRTVTVVAEADTAAAQTSIGAIKGRVINVIVDAEVAGAQTEISGIKGRSVTVTAESEIAAAQTAIDGIKGHTVTVTAEADTAAAQTSIGAIKGRTVTVAVEADTAAAQTSIGGIKGRVINVIVDAEVAGAQTEINGIKGRTVTVVAEAEIAAAQTAIDGIKGHTVTVTAEADTAAAQTSIGAIKGRVINVIVDAEVAGAQTEINGIKGRSVTVAVEAEIAAAQTAIDGIKGRTVTVTVEAVTAGAQTAINGIKGRVINVIVDAEVAGAQTEINGIKGRTVTVAAAADIAAAQTSIGAIKGRTVTVAVEADTAAAQTSIGAIKGRTVTVAVEADTAAAQSSIGAIKGRIINVIVDAEVAGAQTEINGIKGRTVTVTAEAEIAAAQTAIDGIKGRTITVTVDADTAAAQSSIGAIKGRIINVIVDAEVAGAQTEINAIKGGTVTVAVDADIVSAQGSIDGIIASTVTVPVVADMSGFSVSPSSLSPVSVPVTPTVNNSTEAQNKFGGDMKVFLDHFVGGGMGGFRIPVSIGALGPMALPIIGALGIAGGVGVAEKFGYARDSLFANDAEYQKLADTVRQGEKEDSTDEQIEESRKARVAMENMEEEWRLFVNKVIVDQDSKATPIALTNTAEILRVNGIMLEKIMTAGDDGKTPLHVISESVVGLARGTESADELILLMADLATDAMIQFKKDPEDLAEISTLLAGMAKESKASLRDVAYFFSAGGGMAAQSGITIEDFVTAGTISMPYFRSGMDLGTSLKMLFQNMTLLTGKDYENLEKYGGLHEETIIYNKDLNSSTAISGTPIFYTPEGEQASDESVVAAIQEGFKDLSAFQRAGVVAETFGSTHVERVERILKGEGTDKDIAALRKTTMKLADSALAEKYGLLHKESISYTTTETGERKAVGGTPIWFDRTYDEEEERWEEEFVGMPRFIEMLQDILEPMTGFERSKFLGELAGSDAIRAVAGLVDMDIEGWDTLQTRLLETTTEELAEIKKGNIKSEAQRMISLLQAITIGVFKGADSMGQAVLAVANTGLEFFLAPDEQEEVYGKRYEELQTKKELGIKLSPEDEVMYEQSMLHKAIQAQDPTAALWAKKLMMRGIETGGPMGTFMKLIAHQGIDTLGDAEAAGFDKEQMRILMQSEVETWGEVPQAWSDFLYGWLFDSAENFFTQMKDRGEGWEDDLEAKQMLGLSPNEVSLVEAGVTQGDARALSNTGVEDLDDFATYLSERRKNEWRDWLQLDPEMREGITFEQQDYGFDELKELYQEFRDEQVAAARAQKAAESAEMQRRVAESASQGNINISGRETKYSAYGNEISYEPMALEAPFFDESDLISGGVAYKDGQGIYAIKAGDTLGELATRFGTTVDILVEMNDIADKNVIRTGAKLKIPTKEPLTKPDTTPIETLPIGPLTMEEQEILAQGGEIKTKPTQPKFTQPEDLVKDDTPLPDGHGVGIDPWLVDGQGEGESAPKITRPTPKPTT